MCFGSLFCASLARARVSGFFVVVFFLNQEKAKSGEGRERETEEKKSQKSAQNSPKRSQQGSRQGKIKRQKQSTTQTHHTQTRKHHSRERETRSLFSGPPAHKRARTHTHTHINGAHTSHGCNNTHKKKIGEERGEFLGCNSTTVCRIRFRLQPAQVEAGKKYAETF